VKAIAVIPARYASKRFPGKALAAETGKPLVQHVYERVARAAGVAEVIVATDDERIRRAVEAFGGVVAMTRADHASGTDRVAEVAAGRTDVEIVINVQGDEPELEPNLVDRLVALTAAEGVEMATLAAPLRDPQELASHNVNKVVIDRNFDALYFSRCPIPYDRDGAARLGEDPPLYLKHIGIYGYRRAFLLEMTAWPPGRLEQIERLEQLRVLEHGRRIRVGIVHYESRGVDTPEDYAAFVRRYSAGSGSVDPI
jgi:3-deoxy-manno-octulosonate cytidylyltransferase (CMP-KDO synthetase)